MIQILKPPVKLKISSYKKNIGSSIITQYGNTLMGFISSIFLTRILSDYGRGEMALYMNFISLSILFFSFSLSTGVVYFISSNKISPKRILKLSFFYYSFTGLLLSLIILILHLLGKVNFVFSENNQNLFAYLICICSFFFTSINTVINAIFNGIRRIHFINMVSLAFTILNLGLLLGIYFSKFYLNKNEFLLIIGLQFVFQIFQFAFNYFAFKKYRDSESYESDSYPLVHSFKQLFKFSKIIYFTNLLTFFAYKLDVWIVYYYAGISQLGIYTLAVSLAQLIWLMPNAIAFVNLSEVSRKSEDGKANKITVVSYRMALYFSLLTSLAFLVFCYIFVPFLYGKTFYQVPYYILLLFIGVVPFAPVTIISSYLASINKYNHNLIAVVIGLIICIILDFSLIPVVGVTGACIASSISYLSICIYLTIYFKRITKTAYRELFIIKVEDINMIRQIFFKYKI